MPDIKKFKGSLRLAGRRNPQLLAQKLENLELSDLELIIMKLRYIDGLLFKQILSFIPVEERRMYALHKSAVNKAVDSAMRDFVQPYHLQ